MVAASSRMMSSIVSTVRCCESSAAVATKGGACTAGEQHRVLPAERRLGEPAPVRPEAVDRRVGNDERRDEKQAHDAAKNPSFGGWDESSDTGALSSPH